jgi:protein-S-isoprenylcysteine O-methyltransferase Ste14
VRLSTPSLRALVSSLLLGAGVALACLLLPLIHLIAGPLGPAIGGFVAANRSQPGGRGRAIIAITIGTAVAGLVGVAATVFVSLAGKSQLPSWFPSSGMLAAILAGVWVYGCTLGAIGASISVAIARKQSAS